MQHALSMSVWYLSRLVCVRCNICTETLSTAWPFSFISTIPMLYWLHITGHSGLLFAPFLFSGVGCIAWVFFRKTILTLHDSGTKESKMEEYTWSRKGVEVCGAHFFVREPALHQLSGKLYLSLGWLFTLLYRAPQFRGAKFLRIALRGPWIFFFPVAFSQGLLDLVNKE